MQGWTDQAELIQTAAGLSSDDTLKAMFPQVSHLIDGQLEFVPVQTGLFCSVNDFRTRGPGGDRMVLRNCVAIQIVKTASVHLNLPGHARYRHSGARITLTTYPKEVRQVRGYDAGTHVQYIGAWADPQLLIDGFGVQVDGLGEPLRSFFRGEADAPASVSMALPSRLWATLDDIFGSPHTGVLRKTYLQAKMIEMVCEVVSALNPPTEPALRPEGSLFTYRELKQIEAAAAIYMKELGAPPSVAELAMRVGLNRNKLTSGFQDVFKCSPHKYSKDVRMDWAHRLLQGGAIGVAQVAEKVGYTSASAFSRAYSEHFGFPPSRADRPG